MTDDLLDPNALPGLKRWLREQHRFHLEMMARFAALERGVKPPPDWSPPPELGSLTDKEKEIIKRVVNSDDKLSVIRDDMGIVKFTWDSHLASIYRKLGVHGRSSFVRVAVLCGLG